jgi:hypothetical protein
MKTNIKIVFGLFLFILMLMPDMIGFSQDKIITGSSVSEETSPDNFKKKKKDIEENFFLFQVDKLSYKFFIRLAINFIAVLILIRFIYYPNYKKRELYFTFYIFNFIIFLVTYLLNKVEMGMGAAFGLFAVFSMLRYRTENISTKDMTYLFLVIAIGLITAISKMPAFELIILDSLILLVTFFMEGNLILKKEFSKSIQYENIELIKPENHPALIQDLKNRTGLNIHRISIDRVNFLKDTANITVFYHEKKPLTQISDPPVIINTDNSDYEKVLIEKN